MSHSDNMDEEYEGMHPEEWGSANDTSNRPHFIATEDFKNHLWKGQPIAELQTSHLKNIQAMLERLLKSGLGENVAGLLRAKYREVSIVLSTRQNEVISRHEFEITEQDIIELARSKGVPIPRAGAGVYIGNREIQTRVTKLYVRYDTTTSLHAIRLLAKLPSDKQMGRVKAKLTGIASRLKGINAQLKSGGKRKKR